ncbi:MAG: hypothetical protein ABI860_08325 [Gemmatimonadales bacterium]
MHGRFLAAWFAVFVAWMVGSFLVHGSLLHADYAALPALFRTDADSQRYFPLMLLAHLILAGAFVWIYARGVGSAPAPAQGLRFGVAVALLTVVPTYMIYFVVQPMPAGLVVKQILFDGILIVLLGVLAAGVYRAPQPA